MNIIVTGGAGYAGYSVSEALAKRYPNSKIIIYDNLSRGRLENIAPLLDLYKNIIITPWENSDIRDYEKFEKILIYYKPKIVVHLAAIVDAFTTNREGKDLECQIVNNIAAVKIAELCKKNRVDTFIFQSTVSMYSQGSNLKEDSSTNPISVYGKSKYEAEKSILKLNDDKFSVCAIRSATLVGYNSSFRYETILNMICLRSVYGIETNIFESALNNEKSYLYIQDESNCILFAIENINKMKGETFNVVSFNANLYNVIDLINKNNVNVPFFISKEKTINQQVYTVNSDKIKKIGFSTIGTLEGVVNENIKGIKKRKELNNKLNIL